MYRISSPNILWFWSLILLLSLPVNWNKVKVFTAGWTKQINRPKYTWTITWLWGDCLCHTCICIFFSAATLWHIEHRGLFLLNYWLVDVESMKGSCCFKKKVSHLTFLDRKVQCQGHISLLFFDDCYWYSLTAVQWLQWSKADTRAWIPVLCLESRLPTHLAAPLCIRKKCCK